jgi:KUP system potassium uptake protein
MLAWFVVLGAGGIASLVQDPQVLEALSPTWGVGEAAAVLREPSNAGNPFYGVVASWATVPVLVLGTCATIIASEAVIAGAFTVLHQAGGLDFFPDLRTVHTSRRHPGQIYQPAANWALAVAVLLMVVGFQSSERLANAYGVTVSATVVLTVVLYVVWATRRRPRPAVRLALGVLTGLVAAALFAATLPKLAAGGWVPAAIGAVVFLLMHTWWTGQGRVAGRLREEEVSAGDLAELISGESDLNPLRGHVVFLTHDAEVAPLALRALVDTTRLARVHRLGADEWDVVGVAVRLGYAERLDVRHILSEAMESEPDALADLDLEEALFVASQLRLSTTREAPWAIWRQRLFLGMERLARDKADQLSLPRTRTLVIGRELEL